MISPVRIRCFAQPSPTTRGRRCVPPAAGMMPEAELGLAELRGLGGHADVARQRQLAAAAERVAVDGRDRRTRKPLDGGAERRGDAASPSLRVRVRMSPMSEPETNDDSPAPVMMSTPASSPAARAGQRREALVDRLAIQRVLDLGPIDRQRGDRFGDVEVDVGVGCWHLFNFSRADGSYHDGHDDHDGHDEFRRTMAVITIPPIHHRAHRVHRAIVM